MCLPAAVIGVITAVTSVVGSIAQYSQQQQEVSYQNAVSQQRYQNELVAYDRSVKATQEQYQLNAEAANRGYISEQNKLRAEFQKTTQEQQKLLVSSLQAQGTVLASGRSGQSIGLLAADAERAYGRDLATLGLNLATAQNDFFVTNESIFNQAQSANNAAAANQMLQPSAPINAPGPSALGLISGIAGGAMGGYDAYRQLKAPSAGGGGGGGTPTAPAPYNPPAINTPNYSRAFQTIPSASFVR